MSLETVETWLKEKARFRAIGNDTVHGQEVGFHFVYLDDALLAVKRAREETAKEIFDMIEADLFDGFSVEAFESKIPAGIEVTAGKFREWRARFLKEAGK